MYARKLLFSAAFCLAFIPVCLAQAPDDNTPCPAAPSVLNTGGANMFNDQQEQYLGDAIAEWLEPDLKLIPHSGENDYLTSIGQKLLAVLPPSGIHFQFRLYDSGELNAFSVAGGRVYISRKLVIAAQSEDDIAGVIAHELGHLFTHQTAIEMTEEFRKQLGVTSVTDRADIYARFHQLLATPPKQGQSNDSKAEDRNQDVADEVAIYAMTRAGYQPRSFATFFDMLADNHGKTGGALSDFFGITKADSKRYRAALKLVASIPAHCAAQSPSSSPAFAAWRQSIIERKTAEASTPTGGEKALALDPPLRGDLERIRFSPDGKYLLAQDESTIFVSSMSPLKFLFKIDALDAGPAHFTPDSQNIVFHTSGLRVEEWTIASQKRASVNEVIFPKGCQQTALSPDGKLLLCAGIEIGGADFPKVYLYLLSVAGGTHVYENNAFYAPGMMSSEYDFWQLYIESLLGEDVATVAFSGDGRYLLVSSGSTTMGYDLVERHTVALGGGLQRLYRAPFTFVGSDRVAVLNVANSMRSSLYAFPRGSLVQPFPMGNENLDSVTQGDAVILRPLKDYAAGIFDLHTSKFITVSKADPLDFYGNQAASESVSGGIEIATIGGTMQQFELPISSLGRLVASAVSPDGKYLTISGRTRGAMYDLTTGRQVILVRPFSGVYIDSSDQIYANYPKFHGADPLVARFNLEQHKGGVLDFKLPEHAWQNGDLIVQYKPLGKNKSIDRNATLEIHGITDNALLWSRNYPQETPACWATSEDRAMILAWDLDSATAKNEIKGLPALAPQIAALKDKKKGLLLEIVDKRTGQSLHQIVVPERDLTRGWADTRRGVPMGDFVLIKGENDNTVIYRASDSARVGEVFGSPAAQNGDLHLFCVRNRENELVVYDAATAKEQRHYNLDSPIRFAAFQPASKNILVLTADQKVHTLPFEAAADSTAQVAGATK
jgi:Peptidase family M48